MLGKRMPLFEGQQIGWLTLLGIHKLDAKHPTWMCRCQCGVEVEVRTDVLMAGRQKSCGIGHRYTVNRESLTKKYRREYNSWHGLFQRCYNSKAKAYQWYGARGIAVCERWKNFGTFLTDMGPRPTPEHTIERRDVNGHYELANCRWATRAEQARNRRKTIYINWKGRRMPLCEVLLIELKIKPVTVRQRIMRGWSIEDALTLPPTVKKIAP